MKREFDQEFQIIYQAKKECSKFLLFFPGLNLSHNAFVEMAQAIQIDQSLTAIFKHNPHRSLFEELSIVKEIISEIIKTSPNIQFYLVGHSYGCLIATDLSRQYSQIKKNIFISPAFEINPLASIIEKILILLPTNHKITSLNFSGYGQSNSLPILVYKEINQLRRIYRKQIFEVLQDSLFVLNKKDQVISFQKSLKIIHGQHHFSLQEVEQDKNSNTFGHLPIDKKNLGNTSFQQLTKNITDFFLSNKL